MTTLLPGSINTIHPYPVVFATITGSRAFGCASPDSDYDIHGVHRLPLSSVLGLGTLQETVECKAISPEDGLEMDIATHDLKKFVQLLLKGNGNVLEDLYSPLILLTSPEHDALKLHGKGCITKQLALHYKGMAYNQQRRMKSNEIKKLLHLYRCLVMGIHLMRSGELVMDMPTLAEEYRLERMKQLISYKQLGFDFLPEEDEGVFLTDVASLTAQLESVRQDSSLPDAPSETTHRHLESLVIAIRLGGLRDASKTINEVRAEKGLPPI